MLKPQTTGARDTRRRAYETPPTPLTALTLATLRIAS